MSRLTTNKEVSEMNVVELAHNSCYGKDGNARYRDYETDIDARELTIKLLEEHTDIPNEFTCDDDFDDFMADSLQYGTDDILGLIAVFYRNLWAMANLRGRLKEYEDLEEQGKLLKLPCAVGDTVYEPRKDRGIITEYIVNSVTYSGSEIFIGWRLNSGIYSNLDGIFANQIGKTVFLTKSEAEEALKKMNEREGEN